MLPNFACHCAFTFRLLLALSFAFLSGASRSPADTPTRLDINPVWISSSEHTGAEPILDFAPDGKSAVFAGHMGALVFRDTSSWTKTVTLKAENFAGTYPVLRHGRFTPDGKHVVAYATLYAEPSQPPKVVGWELQAWNVSTQKLIIHERGDGKLHSLAINSKGVAFSTGGWDVKQVLEVHLCDLGERGLDKILYRMTSKDNLESLSVAFDRESKEEHLWVLNARRAMLTRLDVAKQVEVPSRQCPECSLLGWRTVSPDGRTLAGTNKDNEFVLHELATGKERARIRNIPQPFEGMSWSADGQIVIALSKNQATVYDARSAKLLGVLKPPTGRQPTGAVVSPDGRTVAVNLLQETYPATVGIYDLTTEKLKLTLGGHGAQVLGLAFHPDGRTLFSSGNDPRVLRWDVRTGDNTLCIGLDDRSVRSVAVSPDGKTIACTDGSTVRLFDADTGESKATLRGHTGRVHAITFSPDGKLLASAAAPLRWVNDEPTRGAGEAIVWDLAIGKARHTLRGHEAGVFSLSFTHDGKRLATGGGGARGLGGRAPVVDAAKGVRLWDTATGEQVAALTATKAVTSLAFRPDGELLFHNGEGIVRCDVTTGKIVRNIRGMRPSVLPPGFALSPDGKLLASFGSAGGNNGSRGIIVLLDAASGEQLAERICHDGEVLAAAFSPDGQWLATGSWDRTIRLWKTVPRPNSK